MADDDFGTSESTYKIGAKKTAAELAQLDANDESLRKWKESLGLKAGGAGTGSSDPRNVVLLSIAMETAGRSDVVIDLSSTAAIEALKDQVMTIKEGAEYRLKVRFLVNHDVVSGLKYMHVVKRKGIKVDKQEEMLGSYGPNAQPYEKKFPLEEAPSGMIARGHYNVRSRFIDDDGHIHLEWNWSFDIKKDWD
ncbi:immunoglobulin E-set [Zopfochytrium polystomum]|nr:immunoglobulin E-set [Zopfochytrium polystomum]